jgi:hypothetical protein
MKSGVAGLEVEQPGFDAVRGLRACSWPTISQQLMMLLVYLACLLLV